ncbi:MAG: CDP-glycerol glycerophosphotransferase family protein [Methanobacteriaceae archaeon]|nr:CDP-glycerol glycerophosphotransferase family protein [Methanobacteriaceae archaeon]
MSIKEIIKKIGFKIYHFGTYFIPVDKNMLIFESSTGRNYSGNPKYIYEELVKEGLDKELKCIWIFNDINTKIPGNAKKVKRSGFKFLYYTAKSGFWIFDSRHQYYLRKNKKTKYIQTWHGTVFKKLGLDIDKLNMSGDTDAKKYREEFRKNTSKWDYLISQNPHSTKTFKRAFDFKGEMLEIGYPRNDILVNNNDEENINKIKDKLNIPKDKKVILYAPTWRDNQFNKIGEYKFATAMDFDMMKESLADDYVLIVKYHYLVKDNIDWSKYKDFIIECNASWDIQELYLISDMMITDYSSVMFDYSILKRPMIYFTYDIEDYKNNIRGMYFDIFKEAPGPTITNNSELINYIKNFDLKEYNNKYGNKYKKFNEKFNPFDNGNASKAVVYLILDNK